MFRKPKVQSPHLMERRCVIHPPLKGQLPAFELTYNKLYVANGRPKIYCFLKGVRRNSLSYGNL
ncbi:hypothetical protein CW304_19305 [Bacillus sp. UFRGS-B20]|nr:hypothetical protein CW304_19305 [Bacillus sp. UFRGS-B20]